jgi:hypothetical protein
MAEEKEPDRRGGNRSLSLLELSLRWGAAAPPSRAGWAELKDGDTLLCTEQRTGGV